VSLRAYLLTCAVVFLTVFLAGLRYALGDDRPRRRDG
jgi:hypothetical protein